MVERSLKPVLRPKNLGGLKKSVRPKLRPKENTKPKEKPMPRKKPQGNIFTYDEDIEGITTEDGKALRQKQSYVRGKDFEIPVRSLRGLIETSNQQGGFSGTVQQLFEFIQKNNPTRKQMEKFLMTTSANKGGLMKKKKLNKGGMIDYRKTGMFK